MPPPSRLSRSSARSQGLQKKKVIINVYDLLPPGRLSSIVWTLGVALLHSGVVINDREYAFGGHDRRGLTGVYWTKPKTEPPGGTFRSEILHGFTYASDQEIEEIIRDASNEFLGPTYNLLTRNCNHFTSHLCMALTGQAAPAFLNRAASIGVALPCVVPAGWIEPPECEVADDGTDHGENARLTRNAGDAGSTSRRRPGDEAWESSSEGEYTSGDSEDEGQRRKREWTRKMKRRESGELRDTGGREVPAAERARLDRTM
ncbi:DUF862-domain-containing protein [Choiromyces venosus 120613-1]|uniref:DUF862-domain-containing protein n=1 Tax=Choiromyces venosus 120613-1 TaxID=1336337 RepID=A0A3N4JQ29_9PEZI|nr:DUF862-domain-containing protein [Choiromyces venosus 120613-1]